MPSGWADKRILITVRTYPLPARKGIEVSCTGGITDDGKWIRLFPVPYRFLDGDKQFKKYEWITASVSKATNDPRLESYKLNAESIRIGEMVSSADEWRARRELIKPLLRLSMCQIRRERDENNSPTLGIFKPGEIKRLIIEPADKPDWTPQQMIDLQQTLLFKTSPARALEKIPFDFRYDFRCADKACGGHQMICTDWEMCQSYRRWRREYGDDWERAFRQRYEDEMINKKDTHFYVGTLHQYPASWIIVGLFYPPKPVSPDLFD